MVGLPQDRHHLPLHKFPAVVAERAVKPLEVQRAEAVAVLHEEATLSQVTAAHCTQDTHKHTHTRWEEEMRGLMPTENNAVTNVTVSS